MHNGEAIVTLKKGEGRTIKSGGAWIYDNEIESIMGDFEPGDIVVVHDFDGYQMGRGFINPNSKIRVRMLTRDPNQNIDGMFIRERVKAAWDYRKVVMENLDCCRVIFGEADWIPGLVVDKYADVLVVESLSLGIDKLKLTILRELVEIMESDGYPITAIFERSDAPVRKKEGLLPYKGLIPRKLDGSIAGENEKNRVTEPIEIIENNVRYKIDVVNGQKTGFFLDQKNNRMAMQKITAGVVRNRLLNGDVSEPVRILDCFTHMGTFALNCGRAAADTMRSVSEDGNSQKIDIEVTGLDISEFAVGQATNNSKLNGLSEIVKFRAANVLDELPRLYAEENKYDVLILDPPAFTKSREATKNAIKGYREINMKGLKLVKDGGYFATCSCSHFMTQELFTQVISQAAKAVHKRIRQIEFRTQAPDHPILWAADESYYLKFFIFQVVDEK